MIRLREMSDYGRKQLRRKRRFALINNGTQEKEVTNSITIHEDEVDDKFGNLAFGGNEYLANLQGSPETEENTEFEEKLTRALQDWLKNAPNESAIEIRKHLEILKKARDRFPKVLKPLTPNGERLYRGLNNPNQKLIDSISRSKKGNWNLFSKIDGVSWYVKDKPARVRYTPKKSIQSWTDNFIVATEFAMKNPRNLILMTTQTDNFFFNYKVLGDFAPSVAYEYEREVIHIGKQYITPVEIVINQDTYNSLKEIK